MTIQHTAAPAAAQSLPAQRLFVRGKAVMCSHLTLLTATGPPVFGDSDATSEHASVDQVSSITYRACTAGGQ